MLLFAHRSGPDSNPTRTRHAHDDIEVLAVWRGRGRQLTIVGEEACSAGDVFVFPVGCRHMSATAPDEEFTCTVMNALPSDLPGEAGGLLAAIFTGMGRDGADGCVAVANAGGSFIVQDEASSVVYGMPGAAMKTGRAMAQLSLDDAAEYLSQCMGPANDIKR